MKAEILDKIDWRVWEVFEKDRGKYKRGDPAFVTPSFTPASREEMPVESKKLTTALLGYLKGKGVF